MSLRLLLAVVLICPVSSAGPSETCTYREERVVDHPDGSAAFVEYWCVGQASSWWWFSNHGRAVMLQVADLEVRADVSSRHDEFRMGGFDAVSEAQRVDVQAYRGSTGAYIGTEYVENREHAPNSGCRGGPVVYYYASPDPSGQAWAWSVMVLPCTGLIPVLP